LIRCEVCGKKADVHHIIHKSEGGMDISFNYLYLCSFHHRGKNGPHRNKTVDLSYKLGLKNKLFGMLLKDYYTLKDLSDIFNLNEAKVKKIIRKSRLYKEGYRKEDIIYLLLGSKDYNENMLEEYDDFIRVNII